MELYIKFYSTSLTLSPPFSFLPVPTVLLQFLLLGLCLCLASLTWSAPVDVHSTTVPPIAIVDSGQEKNEDGSYHFFYQSEDGTHREETAQVHNPGSENEYLEINGSYSYYDGDGKEVVVHYKADNHGFVPEGGNISPQISLAAKLASENPAMEVPSSDYHQPPKF